MKKDKILLIILLAMAFSPGMLAQAKPYKISFTEKGISVTRQKEEVIKEITIHAENTDDTTYKNLKLTVEPDEANSTLPACDYEVHFGQTPFPSLSADNSFYIKIARDSVADRIRQLVLKIKVLKKDGKADDVKNNKVAEDSQKIIITVNPFNESLDDYNYLAYVGTNFDLVDGIKAKNLFFAASIFIPRFEKYGFSVTLYGNRTFTSTDTSSARITPRIKGLGDSSMHYGGTATAIRSRVSDNLGAYFSTLAPLGQLSASSNALQLYYSPSMEFIWRRNNISTSYSNVTVTDSQKVSNHDIINNSTLEMPLKVQSSFNSYDLYLGLGSFTLVHETSSMSVRLQMAAAYRLTYSPLAQPANALSTQYMKNDDLSFSGRLWITEATTGITLEAEIYNSSRHPNPYYGVTLSKAIKFRSLGTIFQPLTAR